MKIKSLVFSFTVSIVLGVTFSMLESPAYADVAVSIQGYVTPGGAEAMACNSIYMVPVRCAVQVRGFYPNGLFAYSNVNMILMPGACDYAYVTASNFPFSYADAAAQCEFVL